MSLKVSLLEPLQGLEPCRVSSAICNLQQTLNNQVTGFDAGPFLILVPFAGRVYSRRARFITNTLCIYMCALVCVSVCHVSLVPRGSAGEPPPSAAVLLPRQEGGADVAGATPAAAAATAPVAAPHSVQNAPPSSLAFPQPVQKAHGGPAAASGAAGAARRPDADGEPPPSAAASSSASSASSTSFVDTLTAPKTRDPWSGLPLWLPLQLPWLVVSVCQVRLLRLLLWPALGLLWPASNRSSSATSMAAAAAFFGVTGRSHRVASVSSCQ